MQKMLPEIFKQLAQGRPELLGPLAYGWVATDLFAWSLGLACASSLSKKIIENPESYPSRYEIDGSRRQYFRLDELEIWSKDVLKPIPFCSVVHFPNNDDGCVKAVPHKKKGRPSVLERKTAARRGLSVPELRREAALGGA